VGLVDAADTATTRIASREGLEVEPRLGARVTDGLESTAALRARYGRRSAIPNREDGAEVGIRRVDHGSVLGRASGEQLGFCSLRWCVGRARPEPIQGGR
jgi:hypothetical protein